MTRSPAIEAEGLVKHFGDTVAVDGVSFVVPEGSVLGLLGPNGAGKTTTVRMMTTLTRPTSRHRPGGRPRHPHRPRAVRRSMGLTGQAATVDELLTGRENLRLIGSLYGLDPAYIKRASDDLLERFSLSDAGDRIAKTYSGGMRRRLDLAVSLIATPPVLFLDEPTTGLDPRSRVELWEVLRELVARRHHPAADHAIPRGGRPAGRQHRGHRPRHGHRRGHAAPAQGPVRGGGAGRHRLPRPVTSSAAEALLRRTCARCTSTPAPASSPPRPRGSAT